MRDGRAPRRPACPTSSTRCSPCPASARTPPEPCSCSRSSATSGWSTPTPAASSRAPAPAAALAAARGAGRWRTRSCPPGRAWAWGQAVFDLGALVCTRRAPGVRSLPDRRPLRLAGRGPARRPIPSPVRPASAAPQSTVRGLRPPGPRPAGRRAAPRPGRRRAARGGRRAGRDDPGRARRVADAARRRRARPPRRRRAQSARVVIAPMISSTAASASARSSASVRSWIGWATSTCAVSTPSARACASRRVGELGGGDEDARQAPGLEIGDVVHTARRARASIGERFDHHVARRRDLVAQVDRRGLGERRLAEALDAQPPLLQPLDRVGRGTRRPVPWRCRAGRWSGRRATRVGRCARGARGCARWWGRGRCG